MNKLCMRVIIILFLICRSFFLSGDVTNDVIGIAFSVKGNLILKYADKEEELKPGVKIYNGSEIRLIEGSGRAKIQIITSQGPVIYSKFPVLLKETGFKILSDKQQNNYISNIGGTVLTERAAEAGENFITEKDNGLYEDSYAEDTLFDWHMELGVLAKEDIEKGFTLVLSKDKSSKDTLSLKPLYFKLHKNTDLKEISYEIIKDNTFITVYKDGKFTRSGNDFIFSFDSFKYETDILYIAGVTMVFLDGSEDYWEFMYSIAGAAKIKEIEAEISQQYTGTENDFEKAFIKARIYREYGMTLKSLQILSDIGLDIEETL